MIRVQDEFSIQFNHGDPSDRRRTTTCEIYVEHDGISYLIGQGKAKCSRHDSFRKESGRKISLTRALKNACLRKKNRTAIWDAYFSRFGDASMDSRGHTIEPAPDNFVDEGPHPLPSPRPLTRRQRRTGVTFQRRIGFGRD